MSEKDLMNALSGPKYIIVSKANCDYCQKAKNLLDLNWIEYRDIDHRSFYAVKFFAPTAKTFPVIFKTGYKWFEYIGGYNELVKEIENEIQNDAG